MENRSSPPTYTGPAATLLPQHRADLEHSGLSDATIAACGFHSVTDPAAVRAALGWKRYDGRFGPCLALPFFGPDGQRLADYLRLKPDRPRAGENGKPIKYESPKGSTNRVYYPPGIAAALADPLLPLVLTEGEKKAAKAMQEGVACLGLVGVYGWQRKRPKDAEGRRQGERLLIPDLAAIPWRDRPVLVCFDSDAEEKVEVCWAEYHLAEALGQQGAKVALVRLPGGPADATGRPTKVGLDDFLVAQGPDAFQALARAAVPPRRPLRAGANEAEDDPDRLARLFLDLQGRDDRGVLTLRLWREEWQRWTGSHYRPLPDDELAALVHAAVKAEFDRLNRLALAKWQPKDERDRPPVVKKVKRGLVQDVIAAMRSHATLPADVAPPTWLADEGPTPRPSIALENGLLDVDGLLAGREEVLGPHSPRWFSPVSLPYPFDPSADCPRWRAFLERNLEGDAERIALLQEWFGYCFFYDTTRQKFLLMEGEGANGKSVVCAVLKAVLGADNCSAVPLEVFGERFQLAATLGKLANIAAEVGELDKAAEGHLKAFTGGEPMQFERKFLDPVTVVPTARLVLATNNRPRFSDRTDGVWRRLIVMPFRVTIPAAERVNGMDKPWWWQEAGELPGIFNWALVGLYRLRREDRFTPSAVCARAVADYRVEVNPARQFLVEAYRDDAEGHRPCQELYTEYAEWCRANGYYPLSREPFGRELSRAFPGVDKRERTIGGKRTKVYVGIGARPD